MERPLVVLDTETATSRGAPHLLELGAVRVIDGEIEDTFESLVCPPVEIEPETTAFHGITDLDVRQAPLVHEVLARFTEWVGDDWMAAHNAGADTSVLAFEYARAGMEPPPGPFLDSLRLAVRHIPDSPDHKLPTLVQVLEFEDECSHRALGDAVLCWKVIEECFERAGGLAETRLAELLTQGGAPLTLPGRRPDPPRMSPRLRPLEGAVAETAQVTILYGEDDHAAPIPLSVTPQFLYGRNGKSYLEAECGSSGLLKTYRLDRIRKVLSD